MIKPAFLERLDKVVKESVMVTYLSLYIHLLDQLLWGLLTKEEILPAANQLLRILGESYQTEIIEIEESSVECFSKGVVRVLATLLQNCLHRRNEEGESEN